MKKCTPPCMEIFFLFVLNIFSHLKTSVEENLHLFHWQNSKLTTSKIDFFFTCFYSSLFAVQPYSFMSWCDPAQPAFINV